MRTLLALSALIAATAAQAAEPPKFQVDAAWPKTLPNNWIMGQAAGVAVDAQDHVWVVQRPRTLTDDEKAASFSPPRTKCCVPAPPVMEFDADGKLLQAWGGPGQGYDWPQNEHGIHVDHKGFVWLAANGEQDGHILKFTRDGKFVLQIGKPGAQTNSNDTSRLGRPAHMVVDSATNEVYVADGYRNTRIIVFDGDTGAYKRHWGAYGKPPTDVQLPPYDPAAAPAQQFRNPVHCVRIAQDGLVYVCDRQNNRIQVFRKDGTFVKETQVQKDTLGDGAIFDIAFSNDKPQRHMFIADGANHRIWTLLRDPLQVVSHFGQGGRYPGQFYAPHNVSLDSKGNIYTVETYEGKRLQKFNYKGIGAVTATTN
jgi:DNA-binding beta-propeller fold protein YncE